MFLKSILSKNYQLNPPASPGLISDIQSRVSIRFPAEYTELLLVCNGLSSSGNLALHEIEELPSRNLDYEVHVYLPGYFMIGDDSGGQAILINEDGELFEIGMGLMTQERLEKSANSLVQLLIHFEGKTLNER